MFSLDACFPFAVFPSFQSHWAALQSCKQEAQGSLPARHWIQSENLVAGAESNCTGRQLAVLAPCQPPSDSASLLAPPPPPARAARARRFSYTRATQGAMAKSSGRRGD
jgi:hypothetical protein